jgi:hypothetical protein
MKRVPPLGIENKNDFEQAFERLRRRDSDSLAAFLMSLASLSGPVGDQVRTFIVADTLTETVESLRERIGRLAVASEYELRHSLGREVGLTLEFIIDSVELLVLPVDADAAFELLAAVFEADEVVAENCGEHDWEVARAYQRAAGIMATAASHLPPARVEPRIRMLVETDQYGMRAKLATEFPVNPEERR